MLDFAPALRPGALVTGVAMAKSGLSLPLAVLMSLTVYAGSAQLASLPLLLASGAPMWVIWAAAFCVNLRFVIFSAQWRAHLGHLPRARLAIGYLLADLNLIAFQRARRGRREPGQVPTSSAASPPSGWTWQIPRAARHLPCPRRSRPSGAGLRRHAGHARPDLRPDARPQHLDGGWWSPGRRGGGGLRLPLKLNIVVAIAAAVAAGRHDGAGRPRGPETARRRMTTTDGFGRSRHPRLAVVTVVTRGFFLFPSARSRFPIGCSEGLKVAPLAALAAVVVPR